MLSRNLKMYQAAQMSCYEDLALHHSVQWRKDGSVSGRGENGEGGREENQ